MACRNRSEESRSAGFGGTGPVGRIDRFSITGCGTITESKALTPARWELRPAYLLSDMPIVRETPGLRRSASTRSVLSPNCASVTARLTAAVVFPSRGKALVTKITWGGCPACESSSDVRSDRNASDICDWGMEKEASSTRRSSCPFELDLRSRDSRPRFPSRAVNAGTTARDGRCDSISTSSGVLTVLSIYSRTKARPIPPTKPTTIASRILRLGIGRAGEEGCIAASTTRIFDECNPAEILASFSFSSSPS